MNGDHGPMADFACLVIGTDPKMRRQVLQAIPNEGYQIFEADDTASAEKYQGNDNIRLILAGMDVPGESFRNFMTFCRRRFPEAEIILVAERKMVSAACEAMRMGALDYIVAPFERAEIEIRLRKAATWIALHDETAGLRHRMAMDFGFDNFIGVSEAVASIRHRAMRATEVESPLAIVGDPGSGREHLASIIHHHGRRRTEPIRVCDATDYARWSIGKDDAGTVIIRNAEALSAQNQAGFQQLLDGSYPCRLIVLGTPKFLEVIETIQMMPMIVIPPLRSRPEDIPALTEYFLRRIGGKVGRPGLTVSPEAMRQLVRHNWPGNVGELEQTLTTAVALAVGDTIEADHVIFVSSNEGKAVSESDGPSPRSLEEVERTQIIRSLEGNGWNFSQTAQQLGIGRTTLWRKIKKYHLTQAAV